MEVSIPSYWRHSAHQSLTSVIVAPLAGVLLSLTALWIAAMPTPTHSVAIYMNGGCPGMAGRAPHVHTVVLGSDGVISWDGHPLAGQAALDARLEAVGAMTRDELAEVHIRPHDAANYGVVVAVMAAAQRNGVLRLAVTGKSSSFKSDWRCVPVD
jgi:biopolymer transport protein ExbD